jgi:hypothetical protein
LTPGKAQIGIVYLVRLEGYFLHFLMRALLNGSLVASSLTFSFFLPLTFHLIIFSSTFSPTANKSIQHYQNYPLAASLSMWPTHLQPLPFNAGIYLVAVSNCSAFG